MESINTRAMEAVRRYARLRETLAHQHQHILHVQRGAISASRNLIAASRARRNGTAVITPAANRPRRADQPLTPAPDLLEGLSRRQIQTLKFLLIGDSEKQVANKLGLSRNTVHLYVTALYRHFDVHSRAELLAHCLATFPKA